MTEHDPDDIEGLFTRDGHVTELTVNRLTADELSAEQQAAVDAHLADCAPCETRVEAVREFDAGFSIRPPSDLNADDQENSSDDGVVSLSEERERRRPTGLIVAGTLAAAAAALFIAFYLGDSQPARVDPSDDGIRMKGPTVAMTVFAKRDDGEVRQLATGDLVHPGERLGFEVKSTRDGYLLIAGVDSSGQVYPVYPQRGGEAEQFAGAADTRALETAVRLDDVGTSERLVAMRCPDPFSFEEASDSLREDSPAEEDLLSDCVYSEVTLKKGPN